MKRGNTYYHLVVARLNSHYNCTISDCYEHPEYLRNVLKDVYKGDYNSIIEEIKLTLGELAKVKTIADFITIMKS